MLGIVYKKLRKAREYLINIYNTEFLAKLMDQATDKKGRYQPMSHKLLVGRGCSSYKGSIIKTTNFPMSIVRGGSGEFSGGSDRCDNNEGQKQRNSKASCFFFDSSSR